MKTEYAYFAIALNEEEADILHMVFYDKKPEHNELIGLIDKLENDESFGLTKLTFGVDYDLFYFEGEKLEKLKEMLGIPDDIEEPPINEN